MEDKKIIIHVDMSNELDCKIFEDITENNTILDDYRKEGISQFFFEKETGEIEMYLKEGRAYSKDGNIFNIKDITVNTQDIEDIEE